MAITTHQLVQIARRSREIHPEHHGDRARHCITLMLNTMSANEANRVADALGFHHLKREPADLTPALREAGL